MPHPITRVIASLRQLLLNRADSNATVPSDEDAPRINKDDLRAIASSPVSTEAFCVRLSREIQDPNGPELLLSILEHMLIEGRDDLASLEDNHEILHHYVGLPSLTIFGGSVATFLVGSVASDAVPIVGPVVLLVGSALSTGIAVYGRHILNKRIRKASTEIARLEFLIKRLSK